MMKRTLTKVVGVLVVADTLLMVVGCNDVTEVEPGSSTEGALPTDDPNSTTQVPKPMENPAIKIVRTQLLDPFPFLVGERVPIDIWLQNQSNAEVRLDNARITNQTADEVFTLQAGGVTGVVCGGVIPAEGRCDPGVLFLPPEPGRYEAVMEIPVPADGTIVVVRLSAQAQAGTLPTTPVHGGIPTQLAPPDSDGPTQTRSPSPSPTK
jgi:hypothetical protein